MINLSWNSEEITTFLSKYEITSNNETHFMSVQEATFSTFCSHFLAAKRKIMSENRIILIITKIFMHDILLNNQVNSMTNW